MSCLRVIIVFWGTIIGIFSSENDLLVSLLWIELTDVNKTYIDNGKYWVKVWAITTQKLYCDQHLELGVVSWVYLLKKI